MNHILIYILYIKLNKYNYLNLKLLLQKTIINQNHNL